MDIWVLVSTSNLKIIGSGLMKKRISNLYFQTTYHSFISLVANDNIIKK